MADTSNVKLSITLFFNRQKDDLVLVYFSGHGIKKEVERCIRNGQVWPVGRRILKHRQSELSLSPDEAKEIENEVLEPFRKHQQNL